MKRVHVLLVVTLIAILVMTSCGATPEPTKAPEPTAAPVEPTEAPAADAGPENIVISDDLRKHLKSLGY